MVKEKCFCNRDITVEELKEIVKVLRENVKYVKGKNLYQHEIDALFSNSKEGHKLLALGYCDYANFTAILNQYMNSFGIKKCIHKIHFLAQSFHETQHFRKIEEEKKTDGNIKGGVHFKGRGLIHLTHDYNYLEYYDKVHNTSLFSKYKYKHKVNEGVIKFIERTEKENGKKDNELNMDFIENKLKLFAEQLSTILAYSIHSAVWFWQSRGINTLAEKKDTRAVSQKVNGTVKEPNGFPEREKYTNILIEHFDYKNCINNHL